MKRRSLHHDHDHHDHNNLPLQCRRLPLKTTLSLSHHFVSTDCTKSVRLSSAACRSHIASETWCASLSLTFSLPYLPSVCQVTLTQATQAHQFRSSVFCLPSLPSTHSFLLVWTSPVTACSVVVLVHRRRPPPLLSHWRPTAAAAAAVLCHSDCQAKSVSVSLCFSFSLSVYSLVCNASPQ